MTPNEIAGIDKELIASARALGAAGHLKAGDLEANSPATSLLQ